MAYVLRPYQQECVDVIDNIDPGSYLVVLATGLGKTMIFSHIKRKGRVLILSHRDELVRQPAKYYECSFGIEKAGEVSHGEEVVSASVQSLIHRLDRFQPDDFDTIITDEAHHAVAPSYRKIYDYFKPRLHLGFTATPNRADQTRLDLVYQKIIYQRDMRWGITNNFLTDIDCLRVDIGYDLSKVKIKRGDLDQEKLQATINKKILNEGVANAYRKYAVGRTVIFASGVAHAHGIAREIYGAVVISAETKQRQDILKRFQDGEIPCLVNCMVLTEGTDLPSIRTILIARPTVNSSLYEQMVGRGLRMYDGKEHLTLIDCVGVTGKLDICTAPSLLGLDPSVVPERLRGRISGMLTQMPDKILELMDYPDAWILNATKVDLFAEKNQIDLMGLNWQIQPDDSLLCYTGNNGEYIKVSSVNPLGQCTVTAFKNGIGIDLEKDTSLQRAADVSCDYLSRNYERNRPLWDMRYVKNWGQGPSTPMQQKYIKGLLSKPRNKKYRDFDYTSLDKYNASIVIEKLKRGYR